MIILPNSSAVWIKALGFGHWTTFSPWPISWQTVLVMLMCHNTCPIEKNVFWIQISCTRWQSYYQTFSSWTKHPQVSLAQPVPDTRTLSKACASLVGLRLHQHKPALCNRIKTLRKYSRFRHSRLCYFLQPSMWWWVAKLGLFRTTSQISNCSCYSLLLWTTLMVSQGHHRSHIGSQQILDIADHSLPWGQLHGVRWGVAGSVRIRAQNLAWKDRVPIEVPNTIHRFFAQPPWARKEAIAHGSWSQMVKGQAENTEQQMAEYSNPQLNSLLLHMAYMKWR